MIDQGRDFPEGTPAELKALTKSIPGLIDKLPYVLPWSGPRHGAALADMIPCVMCLLRPTAFVPLFGYWLRGSRLLTLLALDPITYPANCGWRGGKIERD